MCGIMGYVGPRLAGPVLLEGLKRLEYRGYDSAGIAVLGEDGRLAVEKAAGKISGLEQGLAGRWPSGSVGIGHTRWATHGRPSDANAHPHLDCSGDVVVIHNGIVENYLTLRQQLLAQGHTFRSETDTEVICHLVEQHLCHGLDLLAAVRQAAAEIQGAHAMIIMSTRAPGQLVAARVGNAGGITVGYGDGEMFLASDLPALLPHTRRVAFLADGEVAVVTATGAAYVTNEGAPLAKESTTVPYDPYTAAKGSYKHFMLKEMAEQPEAILDTIRGYARFEMPVVALEDVAFTHDELCQVRRVVLVGMGTSLHAAMVGRYYMEEIAAIPAEVDNASEFRYRQPILGPDTLVVAVTQSGETVDTLAAMDEARRRGAKLVAVCNVVGSQATRLAHGVVYTRCGLEMGVASTKTFTAAIAALYLLGCYLAQVRGSLDREGVATLLEPLAHMPYLVGEAVRKNHRYEELAHRFWRYNNFLYLGRGCHYPIAMEGALKLKEVSYIHAEGYAAGEMKHGPIALIDQEMPVVAIAVRDQLREKMVSNIDQVKAREGIVIAVGNQGDEELAQKADHTIFLPQASPYLMPILTAIPLQFFAYHIAVRRGCDVDQPRNLAKTVTVE
ncbi:MAG: glutamine--fructose-6-phosphate transaminase (isomerizing) [Dehalococcoidia bacterium]